MSKSFRGFVVLFLVIFSYYLLHPSVMYYFFTDPKIQELAETDEDYRDIESLSSEEVELLDTADENRKKALKLGLDLKGGLNIIIEADFAKMAEITGRNLSDISAEQKTEAIERVIYQLQNRIDATGVSEINIRKVGAYRINIQLPGETSSKRIENIVSTTGSLELRILNQTATDLLAVDTETKEVTNMEQLAEDGWLSQVDILYLYEYDDLGRKLKSRPVAMNKAVMMKGDRITSSSVRYGQYGEPNIAFQLDTTGAVEFAQITSTNTGEIMGIILDGRVMSIPRINVPITGGEAVIEGTFTMQEAKDLSLILKSGSLPVPITVVTKDLIDAKIGAETKDRGIKALFIGMILVLVFILFRYRFSGVIASIALLLNAFIVIAFLASFGLTISLPGLAGILLTIGMAIDANVIIYERIREEMKSEKKLVEAVYQGYEQAFWAIFDSNVTTMIAAFVLFYYGTGIIQGFATTLFVGIIVSMFTSLFFTRFVFDFLIDLRIIKDKSRLII